MAEETQLTFNPHYESPLIAVHDYNCLASLSGPSQEECSTVNNIVLMRHGAFCKHLNGQTFTADVNQTIFFSKDSTYKVSHPAESGDRGTVFNLPQRILNDIVRELDPSVDEHPERPFPFVVGPCDNRVFMRHRELIQRLEVAESKPLEPLWADVTALQLVADVLEAAFNRHGKPRKAKRRGTDSDHADRVEMAKIYLASRMTERITLDDLARATHASPFHLARMFQEHTGVSVHRYLTKLRLRASLERLATGTDDLTELALDLGFSSHSHFTDAFRREFGRPPSSIRRESRSSLPELSKNLEV